MRLGLTFVVIAVLMAAPAPALAQARELAPGRTVWITTLDGIVHRGRVAGDTPDAITLSIDGATTTVARSDVRRIEARDSTADGVVKGAIGLGITGAVGSGYLAYATCEGGNCALYTVQIGLVGAAMGAAVGAVAGGLIDAVIPGRQVLFERQTLTIVPVVTGTSRSVAVTVRW
jgi:hypothetical protein